MNHIDIEEQQIVDLYLMGKLPAEEAARFEEHYLSCPECLDRLEDAESLQRGFKRAAGQDAARLAATRQLAVLAWLTRLGRSRQMAFLLLAIFAVAALPGGLAFRKIEELEEARQAVNKKEQERSQAAGSQAAAEQKNEQLLREVEELKASRDELARKEAEARAGRAGQEQSERGQDVLAQVNAPILSLGIERGGADDKPTAEYTLSKTQQWIVVFLTVDEVDRRASYRVVLSGPKGEVWSDRGLRRNDQFEVLSLNLSSSMLEPGDYTLTAEALVPGAKPVPAGRFTFRVLPPA